MELWERELLYLYSENARIQLRELSRLLGKSSQRLKYNLRRLEKQRIIYNPHVVIDYSYFGLLLFRVYFKGGYISEKDKATVLQTLTTHPGVVALYEMEGEFDLAIEVESPNASRFNKWLRKIIAEVPSLNNYKIVLNIVTHLYPRSYLLQGAMPGTLIFPPGRSIIVGGDRHREEFTEQELAVLQHLVQQPQGRLTKLAKSAGVHHQTATQIFRNLQQRKVVRGFQYVLDTNALGIHKHRLFIKLHNLSAERENKLTNFFAVTSGIIQVNKTVGDWDLEIDLEALDRGAIRYVIVQLREEFRDLIETFSSVVFYNYHLKAFLPLSFFQEEKEGK